MHLWRIDDNCQPMRHVKAEMINGNEACLKNGYDTRNIGSIACGRSVTERVKILTFRYLLMSHFFIY